tara:strand:- start:459 stop:782 length:324 start_codon:yes stop_codon:yes gene_type:complete
LVDTPAVVAVAVAVAVIIRAAAAGGVLVQEGEGEVEAREDDEAGLGDRQWQHGPRPGREQLVHREVIRVVLGKSFSEALRAAPTIRLGFHLLRSEVAGTASPKHAGA